MLHGFYKKLTLKIKGLSYTFKNNYLINKGVQRYKSIMIDDAKTQNDLEKRLSSRAGRMFADCVSYELNCEEACDELIINYVKKGLCVCVALKL